MKKLVLIISLTSLVFVSYPLANPFSAKVKKFDVSQPKKAVQKIKFKGFAMIGEQYFGLVQIGKSDFEVVEGDVVQGIRITKVSNSRLDYSINNQSRYILLDSN